MQAIADALNELGASTKQGGTWHAVTIQKVLRVHEDRCVKQCCAIKSRAMANPEHVAILRQGVDVWNAWRTEHPEEWPDLIGADLVRADLREAYLRKAYLRNAYLGGAHLIGADLRQARLSGAHLAGANLVGANLVGAYLIEADLVGVNLTRAHLYQAYLGAADLSMADLTNADLRGADLHSADLSGTNLTSANLVGANLHGANLVETNLTNADLTGCRVYGVSAWNVNLTGATQKNLVITRGNEPVVQVDDLEFAQFIYLLLNRQKLRNVITTLGEKGVLILGRFTERKELLDGIAAKLREFGYLPIIFDFERPTDRDITETVKILAGLSVFVIADITNPRSVPLELQATVPDYKVPFVTILQEGQPTFSMFDDLLKYPWALPLLEYPNPERLLANFEDEVIQPALTKLEQVRYEKAAPPPRRKIK